MASDELGTPRLLQRLIGEQTMNIQIGSIVESIGFIRGHKKSNHGLVISLMADGKIARVFWHATEKSGFCSVKDLRVIS